MLGKKKKKEEITESLPRQNAYDSSVTLTVFGLINVVVDFVPVRSSDRGEFKLKVICPDCPDPTILPQRYICPVDASHGDGDNLPGFVQSTAGRGRYISKDTIVPVAPEEIEEVKEGRLPKKQIHLEPVNAVGFEKSTRPSGTSYRLRPKFPNEGYSVLLDLFNDPNTAYIGEINIRDNDKLFRIEVWNDQLVATEMIRPSDVAPVDEVRTNYQPKLLDLSRGLRDASVKEFNPEEYANQIKARVVAYEASVKTNGAKVSPKPKKVDSQNALLEALEAKLRDSKAS